MQKLLQAAGIRAEVDLRNEKIGRKVREHSNAKIPQIWVIGKNEAEEKQVAIRKLGSKANTVTDASEAIAQLAIDTKMPV